ncbi:MAG: hypothetical protein HZY76_20075 [Anaerolineae bacterium]|nr:MAG: hypothetical protein HZY76_20075 [Anaerolineae bacterium]
MVDAIRRLGRRGAASSGPPWRTPEERAAAACLLAHQGGRLAQFETALDRLLAGAVLLDHAVDWSDDLEGGHFNAFVAYCSSLPQSPLHRAANRRRAGRTGGRQCRAALLSLVTA